MRHTSILLFCLILLVPPAHAEPDWEKYGIDRTISYSATRHMVSSDGIVDFAERRRPKMTRMEMSYEGQAGVMIMREDLGVSYMLLPAATMYMKMNQHQAAKQGDKDVDVFEGTKVGAETINGYASTKYKGKFKDSEGGRGGGYFWVTDDGVLIKIDAIYSSDGKKGQRFVMELRDLKVGPQDIAFFEVPKNYTAMNIGGFGGGGIPGLSGSQMPQAPSAPVIAPAASSDSLAQMVQKDLVRLGYNPGNTNGEMTTATIVAISKFQAQNNMEVTGQVSPQLAGILSAKGSSGPSAAPATNAMVHNPDALKAAQQACLEKAVADSQPKKKKKGFGSLMSAVSKTANLLGKNKFIADMQKTTSDIYEVNSTAKDYAQAAKELGITEDQVADCQNPQ